MKTKFAIPLCFKLFRATANWLAKLTLTNVRSLLIAELLAQNNLPGGTRSAATAQPPATQTVQRGEAFDLIQEIAVLRSDDDIHAFLKGRHLERVAEPVGEFGRDNENMRLQWVREALQRIQRGARLLDAGAGEQQYRKFCAHLNYVSQDFSQYDGFGDQSGLQTGSWNYGKTDIVSDICSIPEPDHSFDAILCTEVFEHILTPIDAVREFSRLLKKDGILILTAPVACLTHFAPYFYYSGFSSFFYKRILEENGFGEISIEYNGSYFAYLAQELNRLPSVIEKYSRIDDSASLQASAWLLEESLKECAKHDSGSQELLAHGLHVIARKL